MAALFVSYRRDDTSGHAGPAAVSITTVAIIWISVWGTYQDVVITGLIMGGGVAAILVSIVWRIFQRRKTGSHPDRAR